MQVQAKEEDDHYRENVRFWLILPSRRIRTELSELKFEKFT